MLKCISEAVGIAHCASHRIIRFGRTKGNHDHDA